MDRNFELEEEFEEIDFIPKHKTFPVEHQFCLPLKIGDFAKARPVD